VQTHVLDSISTNPASEKEGKNAIFVRPLSARYLSGTLIVAHSTSSIVDNKIFQSRKNTAHLLSVSRDLLVSATGKSHYSTQ
jgi:hypothetical protein